MSATNVETVRVAHQAFNRRDFDAVLSAMAEDVTYQDRARGVTFRGRAGFREFMEAWVTGFSDAGVLEASYLDAGDVVIAEFLQSIAEVHNLLYVSASAGAINLCVYTQRLSQNLAMAYGASDRIQADVEGGQITLDVRRAVLVGLLLNEVLSNAYKHAFPDNRTGRITIGIAANEDQVILSVTDTGVGTPTNPESKRPGSLGLRLIHLMAHQLQGTVTLHSAEGTSVEIRFPLHAKA